MQTTHGSGDAAPVERGGVGRRRLRGAGGQLLAAHFLEDGTLRMRVTAPPVDGAANVAVCKVLSKALGIWRDAVKVTHGKTARRKIVQMTGLTEAEVRERLSA